MANKVAKQCCGLTFSTDSDFREHLEEHELESACGCG
jgi:hypothetical protein